MRDPLHPGLIVLHDCLEPLGLTITEGARALGVTRAALSEIVNGRRGISSEMAIRLSEAFGSTPEVWGGLQLDYDLAVAKRRPERTPVARLPRAA